MDKRIFTFTEWLELQESSASRPAAKTGLYPLGYGGIGNYPPAHWLPAAADAILYITDDDRLFDNGAAKPWPIIHLPGPKPLANPNTGEKEPWDIRHLPGHIIPEPEYKMPPGDVRPFSSFVKLVTKPTIVSPSDPNMPD